jgi:hypothetical protein
MKMYGIFIGLIAVLIFLAIMFDWGGGWKKLLHIYKIVRNRIFIKKVSHFIKPPSIGSKHYSQKN